jgi:CRP-like cAMP-binding protein
MLILHRLGKRAEGVEILFKDPDPDKRNPVLEMIGKAMTSERRIDRLEKAFEGESRAPREPWKIKLMTKVHYYTPGQGFGELALSNKKPRAASIFATEDTEFAVLSKKDFDSIISEAVK